MSILDGSTSYDPTSMPNAVGVGATATIPTSTSEARESKPSAKKVARDLLAGFAPAAPVVESASEKERKRRIETLTVKVRQVASVFDELGAIDGDPAAAAAGLKALNTVLTQGTKAIGAITDAKLDMGKAPRAARAQKLAKIEEPTPPVEAETVTDSSFAGEPQALLGDDGNTGF